MQEIEFVLFRTSIGRCAIAWSHDGIVRMQLPEARAQATRALLLEQFPRAIETAPPTIVQAAINAIVALLEGGASDLSRIRLDMQGIPTFHRRVYERARRIPRGKTRCYGDIAAELGQPEAARAVGQALGRNPWALIVPCHRVIAANGNLTGFSAHGGIMTKRRLLAIEGWLPKTTS